MKRSYYIAVGAALAAAGLAAATWFLLKKGILRIDLDFESDDDMMTEPEPIKAAADPSEDAEKRANSALSEQLEKVKRELGKRGARAEADEDDDVIVFGELCGL